MTRNFWLAGFLVFCCLFFANNDNVAEAQTVMLPIQNIPQETEVWCWAAVAQQIVYSLQGGQGTPPQCHMVARGLNMHPLNCCNQLGRFNGNLACKVTGSLQQIQGLIMEFGGQYSTLAPPAHPSVLYNTLNQGRAIILGIRSSPYTGHVVVLRGISVVSGVTVLHINDPMNYFTQPIPFPKLIPFWSSAIVVGW